MFFCIKRRYLYQSFDFIREGPNLSAKVMRLFANVLRYIAVGWVDQLPARNHPAIRLCTELTFTIVSHCYLHCPFLLLHNHSDATSASLLSLSMSFLLINPITPMTPRARHQDCQQSPARQPPLGNTILSTLSPDKSATSFWYFPIFCSYACYIYIYVCYMEIFMFIQSKYWQLSEYHTGRDRGWIVNKLPNLGSAGDDFFSKKKYVIVYFKKSKYFSFRILMFFYVLI